MSAVRLRDGVQNSPPAAVSIPRPASRGWSVKEYIFIDPNRRHCGTGTYIQCMRAYDATRVGSGTFPVRHVAGPRLWAAARGAGRALPSVPPVSKILKFLVF